MLSNTIANWVKACKEYWTTEKNLRDLGPKLVLHVVMIPFCITMLVMFAKESTFGSVLTVLMLASALAIAWFRYGGKED